MSGQSNRQQIGNSDKKSTPVVLYIIDDSDRSAFHAAALRAAGYKLQSVITADEALRKVGQSATDVVVIGHGLSLSDRVRVEDAIRLLRPKPRLVVLYEHSIAKTEQADAVLNVNSEPQHLVQTIRYLLTGSD